MSAAPVLVLGIGNELLGDDGVGVEAARRLPPVPGVEVLDGGTAGLMLLPYLAGRRALLVLDALSPSFGAPGTVLALTGDQVRRGHGARATAHDVGLVDALAAAELTGSAPGRLALVGVVPESVTTRWGLSPLVAGRLDAVLAAARTVLAGWGVPVAPVR